MAQNKAWQKMFWDKEKELQEVKKTSNKNDGNGITIIVIRISMPMGKEILEIILTPKLLLFFTISINTFKKLTL